VPTASADGTGPASSSDGGTTTSSTNTTSSATTAVSASASDDGSVDTSTADDASSTSEIETTVTETDASTSGSVDPSLGTSSGEGASGAPEPICGDGMIESPETCETGDLGTFACSDLGDGYGGTPTCGGCQIDDGPCCLQTGVVCVPGFNDCCDGCGVDFVCD